MTGHRKIAVLVIVTAGILIAAGLAVSISEAWLASPRPAAGPDERNSTGLTNTCSFKVLACAVHDAEAPADSRRHDGMRDVKADFQNAFDQRWPAQFLTN